MGYIKVEKDSCFGKFLEAYFKGANIPVVPYENASKKQRKNARKQLQQKNFIIMHVKEKVNNGGY